MFLFYSFFFMGVWIFYYSFGKKLVCLLSLELMMIILILNYLLWGSTSLGDKSSFLPFIFTSFMVLDSALGISFLMGSSRCSFFLSPMAS